jgi:hypothetical protein
MVIVSDIGALQAEAGLGLHRRMLAEEASTLEAVGAFIGEAVIIPKPVLRMLFIGYSWVRRGPAHPVATFPDRSSAVDWARTLLEKRERGG